MRMSDRLRTCCLITSTMTLIRRPRTLRELQRGGKERPASKKGCGKTYIIIKRPKPDMYMLRWQRKYWL